MLRMKRILPRYNLVEAFIFTEQFIAQVNAFVTSEELDSLAQYITYIPFLLGFRFLIDHVQGDIYFKTRCRGHNLLRARNQFRFVELLEAQQEWIHQIVRQAAQAQVEAHE